MQLYRFSEKNIDGVITHSVMEAESSEQLIKDRYKRGQFVFRISGVTSYTKRRRLKDKELSAFSGEVSVLLGSGVPIVRAFEIMANENGTQGKMRAICLSMAQALQRGFSLSEVMRLQGGAFPELIISVYSSGEVSGHLDDAAGKMAVYYDKMHKIQQKIKSATSYPKLIGVMTIAIVLFLFTAILPQFMDSLNMPPEALPLLTVIMMRISEFIRTQYILLAAVAAGGIYLYIMLSRLSAVKMTMGRIAVSFPVISKQLKMLYTSRFSTTLSNLYLSGVPLSMSLEIAAKTIGNTYVEKEFSKCLEDIAHGRSLSSAVKNVNGLNSRLYHVVLVGEETGKLGEVLENMGASFDSEVDSAVSKLLAVLSPILLVIMTAVVGMVMAAILMPLMESYQYMV